MIEHNQKFDKDGRILKILHYYLQNGRISSFRLYTNPITNLAQNGVL